MQMQRYFTVLIIGLAATVVSEQARADAALNFASVSGGFVDGVPRVIGWEFTTGASQLIVEQLGVFDFNGDGLLASHPVAIYNADTQSVVVTATVPNGTSATLSGLFRYVDVSATVLQANTGYVIATSWAQNADQMVWSPSIGSPSADILGLSVSPDLSLGIASSGKPASARYEDTTSVLQFPTKRIGDVYPGDPRTVFVGPNFTFTPASAVPEPTTLISAALGLFTLAGYAGWRRSSPRRA